MYPDVYELIDGQEKLAKKKYSKWVKSLHLALKPFLYEDWGRLKRDSLEIVLEVNGELYELTSKFEFDDLETYQSTDITISGPGLRKDMVLSCGYLAHKSVGWHYDDTFDQIPYVPTKPRMIAVNIIAKLKSL